MLCSCNGMASMYIRGCIWPINQTHLETNLRWPLAHNIYIQIKCTIHMTDWIKIGTQEIKVVKYSITPVTMLIWWQTSLCKSAFLYEIYEIPSCKGLYLLPCVTQIRNMTQTYSSPIMPRPCSLQYTWGPFNFFWWRATNTTRWATQQNQLATGWITRIYNFFHLSNRQQVEDILRIMILWKKLKIKTLWGLQFINDRTKKTLTASATMATT